MPGSIGFKIKLRACLARDFGFFAQGFQFFRGHVFRLLDARASRRIAYTLSTVLFAAVHFNPSATMSYAIYAVLFAWAYERWESVVVPMTAHALVNVTAVCLLRLEI